MKKSSELHTKMCRVLGIIYDMKNKKEFTCSLEAWLNTIEYVQALKKHI